MDADRFYIIRTDNKKRTVHFGQSFSISGQGGGISPTPFVSAVNPKIWKKLFLSIRHFTPSKSEKGVTNRYPLLEQKIGLQSVIFGNIRHKKATNF